MLFDNNSHIYQVNRLPVSRLVMKRRLAGILINYVARTGSTQSYYNVMLVKGIIARNVTCYRVSTNIRSGSQLPCPPEHNWVEVTQSDSVSAGRLTVNRQVKAIQKRGKKLVCFCLFLSVLLISVMFSADWFEESSENHRFDSDIVLSYLACKSEYDTLFA